MKAFCVVTAVILAILASPLHTASAATSVTLTTLYQFSGPDGSNPQGPLTVGSDGNFYGVTTTGGAGGKGTIFQITPQGTLTTLHAFGLTDGAAPVAAPIEGSDGNFYGTTAGGGTSNNGTVYQITTAGALTTLHSFSGPDGANPRCQLVQGLDGNFYGTTRSGGNGSCYQGCGTVFMITPVGTLTTLYNFNGSDGQSADSGLVLASDGNFYGTTDAGGASRTRRHSPCDGVGDCGQYPPGTVYQISSAGSLTTLYSFSGRDGANPAIGPIQGNDGAFYGVTLFGGKSNRGTVYTITSAGAFTLLNSFAGGDGGAFPRALLLLGTDGNFYGTTVNGGRSPNCNQGCGTAFRITTDGTLTMLYTFAGRPYPAQPASGLVQVGDNTFYGTSFSGGMNNLGTVFQLTVCDFSLDPATASFDAAGGSNSVSVTTTNGCSWSTVSNDDFITITSGAAGSGNGTVGYSVAANTSDLGRIGTMTVFGEPYLVIQSGTSGSGCSYALSATNATIPAKGASGVVNVKFKGPGCAWSAASNDPFITITAGSTGTGNGKVEYVVPGNTNSIPLTGTMTIAGQTFTVNQDAGSCTFSLSPYGANIKAAGGAGTVNVRPNFSDCDWTAVSNNPFITITDGASGTGRGKVAYTVAPNNTTTNITGSIAIADQTFYVTQVGQPPK